LLECSSDSFSGIFAKNDRQDEYYGYMLLHRPVIIQDVRPEIVDAPLRLKSMIVEESCGLPIYLLRRPILLLWMDAAMQLGGC
jgi:hypothetical protein